MEIIEKGLTVLYYGKGVIHIRIAQPQRFDLRSGENHACFKLLFNEIVVIGFLVITNQLFAHCFYDTK